MGLLSDSDIGKKVFDHEGNLLGEITGLGDEGASVKPHPDAKDSLLEERGWSREEDPPARPRRPGPSRRHPYLPAGLRRDPVGDPLPYRLSRGETTANREPRLLLRL